MNWKSIQSGFGTTLRATLYLNAEDKKASWKQEPCMYNQFHSVRLDYDKCQGCTNCIKHCPMEATRCMMERQNYPGTLHRLWWMHTLKQNHAKYALTDELEKLSAFKYRIALPAPSFFGQFKNSNNIEDILHAFLCLGFDDVLRLPWQLRLLPQLYAGILRTIKEKNLFSRQPVLQFYVLCR